MTVSGTNDVACAGCHHPTFGMADGRPLAVGPSGGGMGPDRRLTDPTMVREARNSPTVVNVAFNQFASPVTADGFMFRGGRARSLERLTADLEPRDLSYEKISALVSFRESLTDVPEIPVPDRVPSGLPSAGVVRR